MNKYYHNTRVKTTAGPRPPGSLVRWTDEEFRVPGPEVRIYQETCRMLRKGGKEKGKSGLLVSLKTREVSL